MVSRIHYIGILRSPVSWAKVNREFVLALDRAGLEVSVTELRGLHYDGDYPLTERLEELVERPRDASIEMGMEYPQNLWKLDGDLNLAWVLYETDLPPDWAASYREHADVFICPSSFVERKAVEAGLPAERTFTVPFGVNTDHYHPEVEAERSDTSDLRILAVGPPHKRKGFRELIRGYVDAFAREEAIQLHIKTYDRASEDQLYPWEFDLDGFIKEETGPDAPVMEVDRTARDEQEMARLFKGADVFILPSYGEAFGLSVLESMAVGTPVIGVDYGPVPGMVNQHNGWLLDCTESALSGVAYDVEQPCTFCVPSDDEIGRLLRELYDQPERIRERQEAAIRTAGEWTWDHSAERFTEVLQALDETSAL
jgi:glycosyltransferase involved in cell wall biosynthesis